MSGDSRRRKRPLDNRALGVLFAIVMVAVVVGVDLAFFRGTARTWERLAANVGIVVLFGAFYFRLRGRS